MRKPEWFNKWFKQPKPVQTLIFNYAIYLVLLIATTLYAYLRLKITK